MKLASCKSILKWKPPDEEFVYGHYYDIKTHPSKIEAF